MKPLCVVKSLHLCCLKMITNRKPWRDFSFHKLNGHLYGFTRSCEDSASVRNFFNQLSEQP
jgi:hypothetical protein